MERRSQMTAFFLFSAKPPHHTDTLHVTSREGTQTTSNQAKQALIIR